MKTLVQWLTEDCKAFDVKPVEVSIGDQTWQGAFYKQTFEYKSDMDAVRWGHKKAGETYTLEAIYVIGALPKNYKIGRENRLCFPFGGEDWYISGFMPLANICEETKEYHPFGINFSLRPWRLPDGKKIDRYEPKPYTRIELKVKPL